MLASCCAGGWGIAGFRALSVLGSMVARSPVRECWALGAKEVWRPC